MGVCVESTTTQDNHHDNASAPPAHARPGLSASLCERKCGAPVRRQGVGVVASFFLTLAPSSAVLALSLGSLPPLPCGSVRTCVLRAGRHHPSATGQRHKCIPYCVWRRYAWSLCVVGGGRVRQFRFPISGDRGCGGRGGVGRCGCVTSPFPNPCHCSLRVWWVCGVHVYIRSHADGISTYAHISIPCITEHGSTTPLPHPSPPPQPTGSVIAA